MFTDGSKRTCTGTIIHDNVVITAAHCFYSKKNINARPELTASFVVIGTKQLFETGYEQYLPIERIVTHPKYRDTTADLSLVFTFAGMTSDKPGTVLPLAGERTSTPSDSNVTVISWGHVADDNITPTTPDCEDTGQSAETKTKAPPPLRARGGSTEDKLVPRQIVSSNLQQSKLIKKHKKTETRSLTSLREKILQEKEQEPPNIDEIQQHTEDESKMKKFQSEYLSMASNNKLVNNNRNNKKIQQSNRLPSRPGDEYEMYNLKSFYKNWRRVLGPQENKLNVETFGLISMNTCNKYLENSASSKRDSGANDVVCYSTDGHPITDKDSGAPAIRQGRLVAVTIMGIDCDGENVAVGMKMNCYCSWIVENLPLGQPQVNCCKNCCDVKHTEKSPTFKFKNQYI